jgi:hypothetical protein
VGAALTIINDEIFHGYARATQSGPLQKSRNFTENPSPWNPAVFPVQKIGAETVV